jgi:hypothetical protein
VAGHPQASQDALRRWPRERGTSTSKDDFSGTATSPASNHPAAVCFGKHHITTTTRPGRCWPTSYQPDSQRVCAALTGKPYFRGGLDATTTTASHLVPPMAAWKCVQELLDDSATALSAPLPTADHVGQFITATTAAVAGLLPGG